MKRITFVFFSFFIFQSSNSYLFSSGGGSESSREVQSLFALSAFACGKDPEIVGRISDKMRDKNIPREVLNSIGFAKLVEYPSNTSDSLHEYFMRATELSIYKKIEILKAKGSNQPFGVFLDKMIEGEKETWDVANFVPRFLGQSTSPVSTEYYKLLKEAGKQFYFALLNDHVKAVMELDEFLSKVGGGTRFAYSREFIVGFLSESMKEICSLSSGVQKYTIEMTVAYQIVRCLLEIANRSINEDSECIFKYFSSVYHEDFGILAKKPRGGDLFFGPFLVKHGNRRVLQYLFNKDRPLFRRLFKESRELLVAIVGLESIEIFDWLIDNEVGFSGVAEDGFNILFRLFLNNRLDFIKFLFNKDRLLFRRLLKGFDISLFNNFIASLKSLKMFDWLIGNEVDISGVDKKGKNILRVLIDNDNIKLVKRICDNNKNLFERLCKSPDYLGFLPPCYIGSTGMLDLFIKMFGDEFAKMKVIKTEKKGSLRILDYFVASDKTDLVRHIYNNHKKLFVKLCKVPDNCCFFPAVFIKSTEMLDLFIEVRRDESFRFGEKGANVLGVLIDNDNIVLVEYIYNKYPDLFEQLCKLPDNLGSLPPCYINSINMLNLFIDEFGVDLEKGGRSGVNILGHLISSNNIELIEHIYYSRKRLFKNLCAACNKLLPATDYIRSTEMLDLFIGKFKFDFRQPLAGTFNCKNNFLHHIISKDLRVLVEYLIDEYNDLFWFLSEQQSSNGWLPLHRVCSMDVLNLLERAGLNPEKKNTISGANLLHSAAEDCSENNRYKKFIEDLKKEEPDLFLNLSQASDNYGKLPRDYVSDSELCDYLFGSHLEESKEGE
jgi:ankyrin repeat protein